MATPLLYERIVISGSQSDNEGKRRQLALLLRTLNSSPSLRPLDSPSQDPAADTGGSRLLGAFVRRLDITFLDGIEDSQNHPELAGTGVTQLVSKLPNLEVLSVRTSPNVSPLDALQVLSPHLKHFHWRRDAIDPDVRVPLSALLEFFDSHPILETFHMLYNLEEANCSEPEERPRWEGRSYPSLRHWVLRQNHVDVLAHFPSTLFPDLDALTFPYYPQINKHLPRLANFLAVHGSHLTTIRLAPHKFLRVLLIEVARGCPRLREVHLVYTRRWITSSRIAEASLAITMPRITTLGLTLFNHYHGTHSNGWERALKLRWKDIFPNLGTIKLLEEVDVDRLREMPEELDEIAQHWIEHGVAFKDHLGLPFNRDLFSFVVEEL